MLNTNYKNHQQPNLQLNNQIMNDSVQIKKDSVFAIEYESKILEEQNKNMLLTEGFKFVVNCMEKTLSIDEYLIELLDNIIKRQSMNCLLDTQIFCEIKKYLQTIYCSQQNKKQIIKFLEGYIMLINQQLASDQPMKQKIQKEIYKFQNVDRIRSSNIIKTEWVYKILEYSQRFYTFKFSFQQQQMKVMINQVRNLCNKQILSIFYISLFFVKSCEELQKNGKKINQIQNILRKASSNIKGLFATKKFRKQLNQMVGISGSTTITRNEPLEKNIDVINKQKFVNKVINFVGNNHEAELELQIQKIINFANENHVLFDSLVYGPCIENQGYNFKSNLKLKSLKNKASLLRVKEKLIKNELHIVEELKNCRNIKQFKEKQQQNLKIQIKAILTNKKAIQWTVTDLLRGKCLFNKIINIYQAAYSIIQRVRYKAQKLHRNIQIVEIDNRLEKVTQDLVFKIKIDYLVCEFQLGLYYIEAQNNINHKMYELERSKALSAINLLYKWNQKAIKQFLQVAQIVSTFCPAHKKLDLNKIIKNLKQFAYGRQFVEETKSLSEGYANKNEIEKYFANIKINQKKKQFLQCLKRLNTINYYSQNKQFEKAINYYNRTRKQGPLYPNYQKQLHQIAKVYEKKGQYQPALIYYKKSLKFSELISGENTLNSTNILNNIGMLYHRQQKYEEAIKQYQKSRNIFNKLKINGREYAKLLHNLGLTHEKMNHNNQALSYLKQSLQMYYNINGKINIDSAIIQGNIATVYAKQNKYELSLNCYYKSLAIIQTQIGKDSLRCAAIFNGIGNVHEKLRKFSQAFQFYQKSLIIYQTLLGKDHTNCASPAYNLANICYNLKNYENAQVYFQKVKNIYENSKLSNANNTFYVNTINRLGKLNLIAKKYEKSIFYYKQAHILQEKIKQKQGKYSESSINLFNNTGVVYNSLQNYAEAQKYYKKALEICDQTNNFTGGYIQILHNYAISLEKQNKELATIAIVYEKIGKIHLKQKNNTQAKKFIQKSIKYYMLLKNQQKRNQLTELLKQTTK